MSPIRNYSVVLSDYNPETTQSHVLVYIEQKDGSYIAKMAPLLDDDLGNKFILVRKNNKKTPFIGSIQEENFGLTEERMDQIIEQKGG